MNLSLFVPELILAGAAIAVILLDLFVRQTAVLRWTAVLALLASAGVAVTMWNGGHSPIFNRTLAVDDYAVFFDVLFAGIAVMIILASTGYDEKFTHFKGEYYALVLIATLGMMLMAAATDLIAIYISLELTSITLYILVSFLKDRLSTEASLKYLLLGAIASAVLLYGMAFIFGTTGQTQLIEIARAINVSFGSGAITPALWLGIAFLVAGFGFKIAAVPFHMWVPDVYEGAPTTVTAFLSVGSKAAGFAVIMRVFVSAFGGQVALLEDWGMIFAVLAVLTMVAGNVMAIPQVNIKRLFGYSSIAQAGYLMVGLAAIGVGGHGLTSSLGLFSLTQGESSIMFFLAAYALTNLAAFVTIIVISGKLGSDAIADYAGMGKRSPWLALALTLALISLTGIPPAAGFMGKFYIFSAAAGSDLLWLVVIAAINSVISAFYYLRVVKVMWFDEAPSREKITTPALPGIAIFLCSLGVLALGIIPGALMRLAEYAAMMVSF